MLGISVYLGNDPEQNIQWIEKASRYGFKKIFTSLHIPEEDASLLKERLILLGKAAEKTKMSIMVDAGPKSLECIGVSMSSIDQLREWNITGLRADYGFSDQEIIALSQDLKVGVNASTINEHMVKAWKDNGLRTENVEAWHNFYPRQHTGISSSFLQKQNRHLKSMGLQTAAFIPGNKKLRGPVYEGLPTLEKHRGANSYQAAVELASLQTDHILIGDVEICDETLELLSVWQYGIITLKAEWIVEPVISNIHTNRMDAARDVVRSAESRTYARNDGHKVEPHDWPQIRPKGSITIDNVKYGRYAGELQITKTDLPADERVNVLGRVREEDLKLLAHIGPGQKFLVQ
ncbi:MupG family TIM beta-alpha barrel fold protein [Fictibacillus enclensis]|uniref:DUF871 domain-containing protein n=1 Tax=Fictibacillus enclensis TaxID=1017270 RepID=UPI0025A30889|nr:MupG family TIM beta-alpha barrel fold protein [Fictibacillus enclensis]MDM5200189.1 MupG family TIM beta-alpha barrel fold protein [Fictibacillus enclensis]